MIVCSCEGMADQNSVKGILFLLVKVVESNVSDSTGIDTGFLLFPILPTQLKICLPWTLGACFGEQFLDP